MKQIELAKDSRVRKTALAGLLAALMLALSFLEGLLPPLPFLPPGGKLGLSNLAVMFGAVCLGGPTAFLLASVKAAFALLTRGGIASLTSLFGGFLSAGVMALLFAKGRRKIGLMGIGMLSAVAHNAGQLMAFWVVTGTMAVLWFLPGLLLCGIASGICTGLLFRSVCPFFKKLYGG